MLVGLDYTNKNKSTYSCDRCNKTMTIQEKKGIYITNDVGQPRKKWDLCSACYRSLERGIEGKCK